MVVLLLFVVIPLLCVVQGASRVLYLAVYVYVYVYVLVCASIPCILCDSDSICCCRVLFLYNNMSPLITVSRCFNCTEWGGGNREHFTLYIPNSDESQ